MSDLLLLPAAETANPRQLATWLGATDRRADLQLDTITTHHWLLAETHRVETPLHGARTYQDDRWNVVFAGDLVDHDAVPFREVVMALQGGNGEFLQGLSGIFAIAGYDRVSKKVYAVSDRRSQKPLYYSHADGHLLVSTTLAAFARLLKRPQFDKRWLWQSFYFNYPIDDTTFLADVKRMPAASVLVYDCDSQEMSIKGYAAQFTPRVPLLQGEEALRHATEVFAKRMPAYYHGSSQVACAITAGWDGRTVLALAPPEKDVSTYTYGVPGCDDLLGGAAIANAVNVKHIPIEFDPSFVEALPHHALETVYLSAGTLGVLRSTLLHAYDVLADGGRRFPLTISGIDVDGLFRGHAMTPDIVSYDMEALFEGGALRPPDQRWQSIVGADCNDFSDYISGRLTSLQERFGPFASAAHHLNFAMYPMASSHFGGEMAVADLFTTVRVPCWDNELVSLAFSIEQSTLSYSQFLPGYKRGSRAEMILQSYLFRELAPQYYRLPVGSTRPAAVLAGEVPYQLERVYRGIKNRVQRLAKTHDAPLEDWSTWLFDDSRDFVEGLLRSTDTLVSDHVDAAFVDTTLNTRNMYMLGKLLTAEIILRLIKTRWQRFW